jgi:GT2 family glycosyltransferase
VSSRVSSFSTRQDVAPDLSIISVTYNSAADIEAAITAARVSAEAAGFTYELIVVDNASADDSVGLVRSAFPEAILVENETNLGFGRANNQAFQIAAGRFWLLVNPDTQIDRDALGVLREVLDRDRSAAAVAPRLVGAGRGGAEGAGMLLDLRSAIGHFLFLNRFLAGSRGGRWQGLLLRPTHRARRVEWAGAAVLLTRAEAIRSIGGFDPSLFMYAEDIELGARLQRDGWTIWLIPAARAIHSVAGSQGGVTARWVDGLHDLYSRNADRKSLIALDLVMTIGLGIRAGLELMLGGRNELHYRRMASASRRSAQLAVESIRGTLPRL